GLRADYRHTPNTSIPGEGTGGRAVVEAPAPLDHRIEQARVDAEAGLGDLWRIVAGRPPAHADGRPRRRYRAFPGWPRDGRGGVEPSRSVRCLPGSGPSSRGDVLCSAGLADPETYVERERLAVARRGRR